MLTHYERRLPHWNIVHQPMFVTFRLADSLPANRPFPPAAITSGEVFVAMDRLLDAGATGPLFLKQPPVAQLVMAALHSGDDGFHQYELHSFVVMPNHVHLLVTPRVDATKWLGPLKGFTAYQANQVLARRGKKFWQDESYDHLVRSGEELIGFVGTLRTIR